MVNTKLENFEKRANDIGLFWGNFHEGVTDIAFSTRGERGPETNELIYKILDVMLTWFEQKQPIAPVRLGPVVEIRRTPYDKDNYASYCSDECDLLKSETHYCPFLDPSRQLPSNCPKPAPKGHEWRLALFAKGEEDSDAR